MTVPVKNLDQIRLEHETLLTEYNALRDELVNTLGAARQLTNYTLILAGIALTAFPLIQDNLERAKNATILLIAPTIFYVLAWTSLRYTTLCSSLSAYIREQIAPRIRDCVSSLAGDRVAGDMLFRWEDKGKNTLQQYGLLYLPIAGAHFALPVFAAIALVVGYLGFCAENSITPPYYDWALLIGNGLLLIYTLVWGLKTELSR